MSTKQTRARPEVGTWYSDPLGRRFEVAVIDEEAGRIEIRYDDGESAVMDWADWRHVMVDRDDPPDEHLGAEPDDER